MLFHVAGLYSGKIVFSVSQVRITLYPSSICILFHDLYSSYLPCGVIVFSQIGAHLYSRSPGLPGGPLLSISARKVVTRFLFRVTLAVTRPYVSRLGLDHRGRGRESI